MVVIWRTEWDPFEFEKSRERYPYFWYPVFAWGRCGGSTNTGEGSQEEKGVPAPWKLDQGRFWKPLHWGQVAWDRGALKPTSLFCQVIVVLIFSWKYVRLYFLELQVWLVSILSLDFMLSFTICLKASNSVRFQVLILRNVHDSKRDVLSIKFRFNLQLCHYQLLTSSTRQNKLSFCYSVIYLSAWIYFSFIVKHLPN